jgi:hypothetical protein
MADATKPKVTPDTLVNVTMKGEKHTFTIGWGEDGSITSWANTLSDLTGWKAEYLVEQIVAGLNKGYGYEFATAAGDLCPIRFLVTKA